jgi:hypothetical protein
MNTEDPIKKNDNDDSAREKYLVKNDDQKEQCQEEVTPCTEEEYIKNYLKNFEDLLNKIDEEIDELDSYGRTMEIKRSIDRLIETLYSQAASEDIDIELETTKHTSDKLNSIKRIKEKRKNRTTEEILSNIFAQQQKDMGNVKRATADVHEAKEEIKSSIKSVLFSVIAHRMDPKKRAGETADSNEKQAHIYGREAKGGILGALLKTFLTAVSAAIHEIVKPLKHTDKQEASFAKQVEESRNMDSKKGRHM